MSNEANIQKCLSELWERERAYEIARTELGDADYEYSIKFATEFLAAEGGAEMRKQLATMATKDEFLRLTKAKAMVNILNVKIRDAQKALNGRQSLLSASAKADFHHANSRGTT